MQVGREDCAPVGFLGNFSVLSKKVENHGIILLQSVFIGNGQPTHWFLFASHWLIQS
jgi:hypothetical protein